MQDKILRYSELTQVQKDNICNGCGSKGGFIKPPSFIFKASCNQHDFYYWRGHTEGDKRKADKSFYKFMKIDIKERDYNFLKKAWYYTWAYSYYLAVRLFGKDSFYYADEMKTEKDL